MKHHYIEKTELHWDLHMELQMDLNLTLMKEISCFFFVGSSKVSKDENIDVCNNSVIVQQWCVLMELNMEILRYQHWKSNLYLPNGLVCICKIVSIDGVILDFSLGTVYGIKLVINERNDMGSLIGFSDRSIDGQLDGSLYCMRIRNISIHPNRLN